MLDRAGQEAKSLLIQIQLYFCDQPSGHLEDFVEAVVLLHDFLFLWVQDGTADQQVEVLTGQTRPHNLRRPHRHKWSHGSHHLRRTPIRYRSRSNIEEKTHLPESEDVLKAELPLESDQQPAETEVQISWILRLWEANRKLELKPSWLHFLLKGRFVTGWMNFVTFQTQKQEKNRKSKLRSPCV